MPRLADLKDQQLYKMDRNAVYGALDALLSNTANVNLIREQWDQLVRVAASLRQRTAPAHVVLQRLANSSDRLAKALTALGQIVKTIYFYFVRLGAAVTTGIYYNIHSRKYDD